jgi:hypothetical protein
MVFYFPKIKIPNERRKKTIFLFIEEARISIIKIKN